MQKKKKLILMYPNLRWHKEDLGTTWNLNPATLCLLAAMVRDIVDVEIIDAQFNNMSKEDFKKEIKSRDPDYVGISVLTSEYRDILNISSAIIKEVKNDVIIVAGGVHVTTMYEYVMKDPNISYGVIGEGEYVLRGLINYLNGDGELPHEGLVYRKDNDLVVQKRVLVEDLTKLPWPAYDLIDYKPYTMTAPREFNPQRPPELPFIRLVTTRGCSFDCVF
jgi:anaerobic magnesium-protoporphyrin IX monomethyl ester cyclase